MWCVPEGMLVSIGNQGRSGLVCSQVMHHIGSDLHQMEEVSGISSKIQLNRVGRRCPLRYAPLC